MRTAGLLSQFKRATVSVVALGVALALMVLGASPVRDDGFDIECYRASERFGPGVAVVWVGPSNDGDGFTLGLCRLIGTAWPEPFRGKTRLLVKTTSSLQRGVSGAAIVRLDSGEVVAMVQGYTQHPGALSRFKVADGTSVLIGIP